MKEVVLLEKIPRNINDLFQKRVTNLFRDKEISLFGIKASKLQESLNVELQDVKIEERRSDQVFLLEDDTLLHLEFQTNYRQSDLTRFVLYDILLHNQHNKRKVTTAIIYSSGVKRREVNLDFETLIYKPHVVFLEEMNGDEILQQLEEKILSNEPLSSEDIINLSFTSFMKSDIIELEGKTIRQIEIANKIADPEERESTIALIYGYAAKFLSVDELKNIKEVFKVGDIFQEWLDEAVEERIEEIIGEIVEEKDELLREIEELKSQLAEKESQTNSYEL